MYLGFRRTTAMATFWLPLVTLSIGLSVTAVYALLIEVIGVDILLPDQNLEEIAALDGLAQVPTFAIVGLLAPLGEEVFFRGFLLAALVPVLGRAAWSTGKLGSLFGGTLQYRHSTADLCDGDAAGVAILENRFDLAPGCGSRGTESARVDIPRNTI